MLFVAIFDSGKENASPGTPPLEHIVVEEDLHMKSRLVNTTGGFTKASVLIEYYPHLSTHSSAVLIVATETVQVQREPSCEVKTKQLQILSSNDNDNQPDDEELEIRQKPSSRSFNNHT